MLEKTVFTEESIIRKLKQLYNINVSKIEKEDRGSANIYYIYNENCEKFVLKEFESVCNEQNVIKEINIINHLKKYDVVVPEYIRTLRKSYYFTYNNRTVILMKYIEGYTKNSNTGDFKQTLESASILGKMVKALQDFPKMPEENIENWYNKNKLQLGKTTLNRLKIQVEEKANIALGIKTKILNDIQIKLDIIDKLNLMDFEGMQYVTHKNSHGDFSIMQFIYKNEEVCAILDFAKARCFPITWEVIRSYTYIDEKCKNGTLDINNLILYTNEFMKYVSLTKNDLKFMPLVYLIQLVTSTFGYKEYINNNELTNLLEFGYWRTNMCVFLYNNLQEISEKLQETNN